MTPELVIIPCGKAKRAVASAPAWWLYTGSKFKLGLFAALALTDKHHIRILSARYGLLPLEHYIRPYDLVMGQPGAVTVNVVREQAEDAGLLHADPVLGLVAAEYANVVRAVWSEARLPLLELPNRGLGHQCHYLATVRDTRSLPAP